MVFFDCVYTYCYNVFTRDALIDRPDDLTISSTPQLWSFRALGQHYTTMDGHEADVGIPRYPGDDPRPTSKRELAGWYCYGWAAEVFTVCAMGMYKI